SGTAFMLVQVSGGASLGTTIANSMDLNAGSLGSMTSNIAKAIVGADVSVTKSQSVSVANLGDPVTYTVNWNVTGETLNVLDTYNYDSPGPVVTGYDGTSYTASPGQGSTTVGTWNVYYD